jgi:hypothetical protein
MRMLNIKGMGAGCVEVNLDNVNFVNFPEALRHVKSDIIGPGGETHKKVTFFIIQLNMPGGRFTLPNEFETPVAAQNYWDGLKKQMKIEDTIYG